MSYLGIDIGTSSVKSVLINQEGKYIASSSITLTISRPQNLYSEQDPNEWWLAVLKSIEEISIQDKTAWQQLRSIGLTGQMHGAVCLDKQHKVLHPAILWNDTRSYNESRLLNQYHPEFLAINGNLVLPGFTAPKILWLKKNKPEVFKQISMVLLPKDYIRFKLTGDFASDMSDSSGTSWLDVKNRRWSEKLINLTELDLANMPKLYEGSEVTGTLSNQLKLQWGLSNQVKIIGGGGDNAAGAISCGANISGRAFISLGTSGVYFTPNDKFISSNSGQYHAFCHCLPNKWHQMGVILSAASCLSWWSKTTNTPENLLVQEAWSQYNPHNTPIFLPYLSGERTPHNDPFASGTFIGIKHNTTQADLTNAILEGIGFAILDCQNTLSHSTKNLSKLSLIGGGAKSSHWGKILANILGKEINYHDEQVIGPSFGVAKLALIQDNPNSESVLITIPKTIERFTLDTKLSTMYNDKYKIYQSLYSALKNCFKRIAHE